MQRLITASPSPSGEADHHRLGSYRNSARSAGADSEANMMLIIVGSPSALAGQPMESKCMAAKETGK
jgi:hypothetical protein